MPSIVRKRDCEQSDGTKGSYVVLDADTRRQVSCHQSKGEAETAARIRDQEAEDA